MTRTTTALRNPRWCRTVCMVFLLQPVVSEPLPVDDVRLHAAERAEQLALFLGPDLELVEALDEILDHRVELGVGDAHADVGILHALTGVLAGPAARLADLIDQSHLEPRDVGV